MMAKEATEEMLMTYHEQNSDIEELHEDPSALEFMRFVAKNRPFVIRGGCSTWPATRKWNVEYLKDIMRNELIKVAITPHGNADSAVMNTSDGSVCFAKPFERHEPFMAFLDYLRSQDMQKENSLVKYSQTQNDNLRGEYMPLYEDFEPDIRFASIALQRQPDAINLWIGNSNSITALHRDNYENLYCQILGSKDFVLLPPVETACVNEMFLLSATYSNTMEITLDDPEVRVPVAIWNPDEPQEHPTNFSHLSRPIRVTVGPGDMLYLPTCW